MDREAETRETRISEVRLYRSLPRGRAFFCICASSEAPLLLEVWRDDGSLSALNDLGRLDWGLEAASYLCEAVLNACG